jgi:hypothetical protein
MLPRGKIRLAFGKTPDPMNDIIKFLAEKLSLPESTVRSGVGVLLNLVKEKTSGTEFEKFVNLVPGSAELIAQLPQAAVETTGGLGGLLGMLGGQAADLAKASSALQQAGVPADKIMPLAKEFFEKAREAAGPEVIEEISKGFPILKTLLKT